MTLKIAMSSPIYFPDVGGESVYVNQLSVGLVKRGYEVEIFVPHSKRTQWFRKNHRGGYKDYEVRNGITVRRFDSKNIRDKYRYSRSMLKALIKSDADIIHSHHFGYYPATAGLIAAKMNKVPHVFGPYYHPPIYGAQKSVMFAAYHITQGLPVLRFSDKVLPHTNYEKKMLMKVGARRGNMELLPNTVDTKLFRPHKKKENIVLFASHLLPTKGPHIALNIAKEILAERKDVRFIFVGSGHMEEELRKKAAKIDKRRILFKKNLSVRELIETYSKAKAVVLPSYYEAFGKVLAESMSCETPVVSTRVGGVPEVVGDAGYLTNYGEWDLFRQHVETLLDDDNLRKRLGKKGRKRMQKNFDIDVIVSKLRNIYKSVI